MSLKALQKALTETILQGFDFSTLPIKKNGLEIGARLSIYQRNTYRSLQGFLGVSFPKTKALLGQEKFQNITRKFIESHPPSGPNLESFATFFPEFLEKYTTNDFLKAVAHFENALRCILLITPSPSLKEAEIKALATKDPDHIFLTLSLNVLLFESDYGFHTYWENLEQVPQEHPKHRTKFLLHIEGLHSYFKLLEDAEWAFLQSLQKGFSLEKALQNALEISPSFDFQKKLSYYVRYEIFNGGPL